MTMQAAIKTSGKIATRCDDRVALECRWTRLRDGDPTRARSPDLTTGRPRMIACIPRHVRPSSLVSPAAFRPGLRCASWATKSISRLPSAPAKPAAPPTISSGQPVSRSASVSAFCDVSLAQPASLVVANVAPSPSPRLPSHPPRPRWRCATDGCCGLPTRYGGAGTSRGDAEGVIGTPPGVEVLGATRRCLPGRVALSDVFNLRSAEHYNLAVFSERC
jgi:hypothetical protein